jgi:GT2 family glycosyltransferase
MDLTVSIVNTSNWPFVDKCLSSLYSSEILNIDMEVYVVDNCSSDGSVVKVKESYPNVINIINESNLGFAANHNQVLKVANGRYILVLNDDTEVGTTTLAKMVKFMDENKQIGISICKVFLPDGNIQKVCGRFPTFYGEYLSMTLGQIRSKPLRYLKWKMMSDFSYEEENDVDWISGVFHLMRREVVQTIGYYDETFPIYYEDVEYCHRLQSETKYSITYNPKVSILHYHGQTMVRKKTKNYNRFIFNVQGSIYYMTKWHGTFKGNIYKYMLLTTHTMLYVLSGIANTILFKKQLKIYSAHNKFKETVRSYYS